MSSTMVWRTAAIAETSQNALAEEVVIVPRPEKAHGTQPSDLCRFMAF
jgi:hypothetical protein